jgi:hypothetical protein
VSRRSRANSNNSQGSRRSPQRNDKKSTDSTNEEELEGGEPEEDDRVEELPRPISQARPIDTPLRGYRTGRPMTANTERTVDSNNYFSRGDLYTSPFRRSQYESFDAQRLGLNTGTSIKESEAMLMVGKHFMGDTELMDGEAKNDDNNPTLIILMLLLVFFTMSTALCCYITYVMDSNLASAMFGIFFTAVFLDLLVFRNISVLLISFYLMQYGKNKGYRDLVPESYYDKMPLVGGSPKSNEEIPANPEEASRFDLTARNETTQMISDDRSQMRNTMMDAGENSMLMKPTEMIDEEVVQKD